MILQTTKGFSGGSFTTELFPLGTWCGADDQRPSRTAEDLESDKDVDVPQATIEIVEWLERCTFQALNDLHNVNFTSTTWRHTLGTYFRVLVPLLLERYNLISRSIDQVGCTDYTCVKTEQDQMIPNSRNDLQVLVNSHIWNHHVIGLMCEQLGLVARTTQQFDADLLSTLDTSSPTTRRNRSNWRSFLQFLSNSISRRSGVLITQTLLPKKTEVALCLRNRTLPYFWTQDFTYSDEIDRRSRDALRSALVTTKSLHAMIGEIAVSLIPRLYIEDFQRHREKAQEKLPRSPKVIFTSHLHMASEEFLLWVAEKKQGGCWVCIGQHGGVHCLADQMPAEVSAEIEIADTYLSWGKFADSIPNGVRSPILVNVGRRPSHDFSPLNKNDITLVLDIPYRYPSMPRGMSCNRFDYAESINLLLEGLGTDKNLAVGLRLHQATSGVSDPILPLIRTTSGVRIDHGVGPINGVYRSSRLIVTTSIGTTFFQTLHRDIPTVMLLKEDCSSLSPWASHELQPLRDASILFSDERDLTNHLNLLDNGFEDWWHQVETQAARKAFLETFSIATTSDVLFYKHAILPAHSDGI